MILSQAQAEAVYSAMVALNNVSATVDVLLPNGNGTALRVYEALNGSIHVAYESVGVKWVTREKHEDQAAFATAYGLNSDEPQSDVAASAGGLTQTAIER